VSFIWMCKKCGEVTPDTTYLSFGTGTRELTRCPGNKGQCECFLSSYKRVRGKDDYGHS